MHPVGNVAVEGARLHGNTVHSGKGLVCNIEGLQHPEACRRMENDHCSTIFLVTDNNFRGKLMMLLTRCCVPIDVDQRAS